MIKDKHPAPQPAQPSAPAESLPEEVSANPFVEIYRAVKRAVLTLRENPDDPLSPPLFKTVAIDNGQFARVTITRSMRLCSLPCSSTLST